MGRIRDAEYSGKNNILIPAHLNVLPTDKEMIEMVSYFNSERMKKLCQNSYKLICILMSQIII